MFVFSVFCVRIPFNESEMKTERKLFHDAYCMCLMKRSPSQKMRRWPPQGLSVKLCCAHLIAVHKCQNTSYSLSNEHNNHKNDVLERGREGGSGRENFIHDQSRTCICKLKQGKDKARNSPKADSEKKH